VGDVGQIRGLFEALFPVAKQTVATKDEGATISYVGPVSGRGVAPVIADEFRQDAYCPEGACVPLAKYRLEIAHKAMKQRMGDKQGQPEGGNRHGMMMEVMIGMPHIA